MESNNNEKTSVAIEQVSREARHSLNETQSRRRNPTMLKLQWVAERARKLKRISDEIEAGTYRVESQEIAKAILKYNSF